MEVAFNSSRVKLQFNDEKVSIEQIEQAITKIGYEVEKSRVK